MEAGRIVAVALSKGDLAPADKTYLSQWVAARTGLNQADADKRVTETIAQAKAARADAEGKAREAAEAARKAGAYLSLWVFVSMLAGAFCASYAATIGGRQRDSITVA
jgi:regulator of protease activity HflC (stomatin/prohibitin superfamily)